MEQFKFPLQKLLDIRQDKEEQSKLKFVEAQRQKKITEEKLVNLKETYAKHNVNSIEMTMVERKMKNHYLNAVQKNISQTNNELLKKNSVEKNCREDLKIKQIERKTVEIIKNNKYDAYKKEEQRIEQIQNDEFALYAHIRKAERR